MKPFDNAALRLFNLLTAAKEINAANPCLASWKVLLDTEEQHLLMSRLGKVMELPAQAMQEFGELFPDMRPLSSHWYTAVNTAFTEQNFKSQWASFVNHIDHHSLNYLKMTAEMVSHRKHIGPMTLEASDDLRAELSRLIEEVLSAEIDESVKRYSVRALRKIVTALEEYKLTGAEPILDAVDASIGHIGTDPAYREFLGNTSLGQRITSALTTAANLVTVATGLPQLPAAWHMAKNLLTTGSV